MMQAQFSLSKTLESAGFRDLWWCPSFVPRSMILGAESVSFKWPAGPHNKIMMSIVSQKGAKCAKFFGYQKRVRL